MKFLKKIIEGICNLLQIQLAIYVLTNYKKIKNVKKIPKYSINNCLIL